MNVGILGASGFAGFELLKILSNHPAVEVKVLNSESFAGKKVKYLYPEFNEPTLCFTNYSLDEINALNLDLVFLAVPQCTAMKIAPKIQAKIIDLSSDYRFPNPEDFKKAFGIEHEDKQGLKEWTYGLPELFRSSIKKAEKVANPGCYATACILSALPLSKKKLFKKGNFFENFQTNGFEKLFSTAVFDCKSGYSGAGREKTSAIEYQEKLKDNILAYNLTKHKHLLEIQQFLGENISFTPHVLPFYRGILCTAHFFLKKNTVLKAVEKRFEKFYSSEPFVKVIAEIPDLHSVQKNNQCIIGGFETDDNGRLVIVSAIDNLVKGAAGQAVQNMNLMLGFEEKWGLVV